MPPGAAINITAVGDKKVGANTSDSVLHCVNINTAAASSVLKVYSGQSTTGSLVATIDCSSTTGRSFTYDIRCPNGIYVVMTGGNADVTVTYV